MKNQEEHLRFYSQKIQADPGTEIILGHGYFSPLTIEELFRAIAIGAPTARFGIGMVEGSTGFVRKCGNTAELVRSAADAALGIGAGHCFVIQLRDVFPTQIVPLVKNIPTVTGLYCATGNHLNVVLASDSFGVAVLGVMDGQRGEHVESDQEMVERRSLLIQLGYSEDPTVS